MDLVSGIISDIVNASEYIKALMVQTMTAVAGLPSVVHLLVIVIAVVVLTCSLTSSYRGAHRGDRR